MDMDGIWIEMTTKQSVGQIEEAYRRCVLSDFPSDFSEFLECDGEMCPPLKRPRKKTAGHGHRETRSPKFAPKTNAFEKDLRPPSSSSASSQSSATVNDSQTARDYRIHSLSRSNPRGFIEKKCSF
jgi:hypothetical protein